MIPPGARGAYNLRVVQPALTSRPSPWMAGPAPAGRPSRRASSAGGFSLVEALAAVTILGFALLIGLGVVIWADRLEQRAMFRMAATELAASVAERVRSMPYESVASGSVDLSNEILPSLPGRAVQLDVREDPDLLMKQVAITVSWEASPPGRLQLDTAIGSAEVYR